MNPFHCGSVFLHLSNLHHLGCKRPGCAALAFQGAGNVQESTKTSSNWVAAALNEVQRGGGKVAVNARLWHNLSSQETRCKSL